MIASVTSLFNGCTHTHTLATHRERFAITFWKGKINQKVLTSTNSEKKTTKGTHHSIFLKDTMKKRITTATNTSSFNACLHLTCFIVTKLITDSVHFDDINPSRVLSYINLIHIALN